MSFTCAVRTFVLTLPVILCLNGQNTATKDAQPDMKGMPPRATPNDYSSHAQIGTLTIAAGATSGTINVPIVGDVLDEDNETYTVVLSSPVNGLISTGTGLGTITDNDAAPSLVINDVTVNEPDSGTVNAAFTVTLSAVSGRTVTVSASTLNVTATAPADYTALANTLTFAPGTRTQTVTVTVATLEELDKAGQPVKVIVGPEELDAEGTIPGKKEPAQRRKVVGTEEQEIKLIGKGQLGA